jgi:hypothetical protein
MGDRELLERAAKAAEQERSAAGDLWSNARGQLWNPLTDDGDALRLAVKLHITPHIDGNLTDAESSAGFFTEPHFDDPYVATRRAIVLAAAEIRKQMVGADSTQEGREG